MFFCAFLPRPDVAPPLEFVFLVRFVCVFFTSPRRSLCLELIFLTVRFFDVFCAFLPRPDVAPPLEFIFPTVRFLWVFGMPRPDVARRSPDVAQT